jgi:alpha-amylase
LRAGFDLRRLLETTLVSSRPELAVTFVDNHDTQPLQSLEEFTEQWFKPHAYALILLREKGYPCVFYADLYGTAYNGTNRSGEACSVTIPKLAALPLLLQTRKTAAYGIQHDYFDHPRCVGWTREGVSEIPASGCTVLISNDATQSHSKTMFVGRQHAGKTFYDAMHPERRSVMIDTDGYGVFQVPPSDIAVYIRAVG